MAFLSSKIKIFIVGTGEPPEEETIKPNKVLKTVTDEKKTAKGDTDLMVRAP